MSKVSITASQIDEVAALMEATRVDPDILLITKEQYDKLRALGIPEADQVAPRKPVEETLQ